MFYQNKNKYVSYWLLLITILVGLMIIVGGLTRLTDSGLSITRWDLFKGVIPPFRMNEWEQLFSLYKEIPEYNLLNYSMSLHEFKFIYWWEYGHRMLGRIIGIFYFIPLIYFTYKKKFNFNYIIILYGIFLLIFLQGVIGWYMVKSGLTDRVDISQYRLSLHLTLAFVIFIFLLWSYFKSLANYENTKDKKALSTLPLLLMFFILLQISIGAFVSGLDAGKVYQTWPLMNFNYFPDDSSFVNLFSIEVFESPSLIQFIHRNLAYFIFIFLSLILFIVFKNNEYHHLRKSVFFVFCVLFIQIVLGILTVLTGANIYLASLHQFVSIILVTSSLYLIFKNTNFS